VVWSGNPMHKNDRNRSIAASEFAQIFNRATSAPFKGTVISLQKKPCKENLADYAQFTMIDVSDQLNSWSDTAQALKQLDHLVSVDTSVAHLGAAMGVQTHILIPRSPDWRWGIHKPHTFWYPKAKLHRQDEHAHWHQAFDQIARDIA
jgi:ADP-heptose:LPS heptosyltransferase